MSSINEVMFKICGEVAVQEQIWPYMAFFGPFLTNVTIFDIHFKEKNYLANVWLFFRVIFFYKKRYWWAFGSNRQF
jgi:hypothetical protein